MPTLLERERRLLAERRRRSASPLRFVDPLTGQPFAGNVIPRSRISPQAASLLGYYPLPNLLDGRRLQLSGAALTAAPAGSVHDARDAADQQSQPADRAVRVPAHARRIRPRCSGSTDANVVSGVDTSVTWTHRVNQFFSIRPRVQFTQITTARHAVLRQPHERVRRRRHHGQQSGPGELGTAEPDVLEHHRRSPTRLPNLQSQRGPYGGGVRSVLEPRAATTSRSAATCGATTSTSSRSRTRVALRVHRAS